MPDIKTRFTLDGEKEYNAALKKIGDGMSVLNSEMRKVSAEYEKNGDSVEALSAKNDVLDRKISTQAEKIEYLKAALQQSAEKYKEADERTMSWQRKLNDAEAELSRLNNQVDENNEKIAEAQKSTGNLGDVVGGLTEKFGIQLPDGMKKTMNSMGSVNKGVAAAAGGFALLATAIIKAEKALMDMTKESAAYADNILTMSQTTGQTTEQLQEFSYAAELIDVSVDTLQGSLTKLTNNMQNAIAGTGDAKDAFTKLGVSLTDADGSMRSANDVFYDAIDALGTVQNATERDALAMDIFGRSAQDLNPLIIQGADTLRGYAQEAHDMGYVLENDALNALGAVDDGFQRLKNTQEAVSNQISAEFAPYMAEALGDTADFIKKIGEAFKKSGIVEDFGSILTSASELLAPLGDLVGLVLPALEQALHPVAELMAAIADTANLIIGLVTFDGDKIKTALGWNVSSGQLSNQQKLYYKNALNYNSYTEGTGWSGGGGYIEAGTGKWVPYNAPGTDNWIGGFTTVAENGPERIYLPSGSRVQTASETRYTGGGSTINIERVVIDAKNIKQLNDLVRIFENERITSRMGVR